MQVLVDTVDEEGAVARSSADAPEIDGLVYIENGQTLKEGDFVNVSIIDSDAHDLWAEIAG
jgi:ribosomal protein S12 methylthiotransferase